MVFETIDYRTLVLQLKDVILENQTLLTRCRLIVPTGRDRLREQCHEPPDTESTMQGQSWVVPLRLEDHGIRLGPRIRPLVLG